MSKIVQVAESHQNKMAAVFDIDSTLYNVAPRITQIIREFASDPKMISLYPLECEKLEHATHHPLDWGVHETSLKIGISEPSAQFKKDLSDFWFDRFHSDEYLNHDEEIEGASKFVNELHDLNVEIIYLTGRDVHRYLNGTLDKLVSDLFPISNSAEAVLKPHLSWEDAKFKSDYLGEIKNRYRSIWFFENEPVNLNQVDSEHPEIELVFFDGAHSGKEQPRPHYHRIQHFNHR